MKLLWHQPHKNEYGLEWNELLKSVRENVNQLLRPVWERILKKEGEKKWLDENEVKNADMAESVVEPAKENQDQNAEDKINKLYKTEVL